MTTPEASDKPAVPPHVRAWAEALSAGLDARRAAHLYRELREVAGAPGAQIVIAGETYLQFCTNNYLGLAADPEVIEAARDATARYGAGSGAARLVAGSMEIHHELERALAAFKGAEAALLFPSGYTANLAVLTTLTGPRDIIASDKLNHASLLDAARFSGAAHRTFPHLQYPRAEALLQRAEPAGRRFLVTDTVFSMDGDVADLPAACAMARRSEALVVLDEAHATGVLGPRGAGLAELQGVEHEIAVSVGTLSKALGSAGGFVTGPRAVIETLVNEARPFIFTTAPPPATSAAALAALRIVQREPRRRQRVLALAAHVKRQLTAMGFDCGGSCTPIVPVMMPDAETAVRAAAFLRQHGVWVPAIRPPTVKVPRLRVSLMATHTDDQVARLLEAMRGLRERVAG